MAQKTHVETLFAEAIEIASDAERAAFLDQVCQDNPGIREEIERLVGDYFRAGKFLEKPVIQIASPTTCELSAEKPGTQIGPYKLLQQIGEGGMGVVYMAEQHKPVKRRVALKIIKPGMDSRQVIARFEAERQALSLMDHPNIAKVLDAGTTASGRPYFVMELVKGQPITQYCDEKHLTPRQRLELLLPVCQAIQHAHQKGIIHRDIKPTNILVAEYDQQGVPKVIDFGVAKAISQPLTEKTMFTGLGQIVGTLEYMSPEQAKVNQLDIDTRSDIYSLGVLMYELLTGSTPFDKQRLRTAAWDEMLRIIREEEPQKPSTRLSSADTLPSIAANRNMEPARLGRTVRGELDWIVMKALEKDRGRRYESATAFAADLQHYLNDEPVVACPPSAAYRFRKFARRNKGGLAVASLVLFFLVLFGSGVGWAVRDRAAIKAEAARRQAEREVEAARQQRERQAKLAGQVESILAEVDRLEGDQKWPEALAAARRADAALTSGEADPATAERVHQRLKELDFVDRLEQIRLQRATWVDGGFDDVGADRDYALAFRAYGVDVDELAVATVIDRLNARPPLAVALAAALDDWVLARVVLTEDGARCKNLVAVARRLDPEPLRDRLRSTWEMPDSEAQDELRRLAESIDLRAQQPATIVFLARRLGQPEVALRLLSEAQLLYSGDFWINLHLGFIFREKKDRNGAIRYDTAAVAIRPNSTAALTNLGIALSHEKKLHEAIVCYRKVIELEPKHIQALNGLGNALSDHERLDEAIACYRQAIEIDPKFAVAYNNLGLALRDQNKLSEALAACQRAIDIDPNYAAAYNNLGLVLREQKKLPEALAACQRAIDIDSNYAVAYLNLGRALEDQGKPSAAIAAYITAINLDPNTSTGHFNLGNALCSLKKLDEAADAYRKAIELNPKSAIAYGNLGNVLRAQKKLDQAIVAYDKAIEIDPKYVSAHNGLGAILCDERKEYDKAIECFRKALETDPKDANAYRNLGIALGKKARQQRDMKNAAVCLAVAAEYESLNLAEAAFKLYDAACIRALCASAIQEDPTTPADDAARLASEQADLAMAWLHKAVAAGYRDTTHIKQDKDVDALREREDFNKLIADLESQKK